MRDLRGPGEPVYKPSIKKATAFRKDLTRESQHSLGLHRESRPGITPQPESAFSPGQRGGTRPFCPVAYILPSVVTGISSNKERSICPQFRFGNTNYDSTEKNHVLQFIHRPQSFLPAIVGLSKEPQLPSQGGNLTAHTQCHPCKATQL